MMDEYPLPRTTGQPFIYAVLFDILRGRFNFNLFVLSCIMSSIENDATFRVEKSLGLLTTKFVYLLQNSKHGILDLNTVVLRLLPATGRKRMFGCHNGQRCN